MILFYFQFDSQTVGVNASMVNYLIYMHCLFEPIQNLKKTKHIPTVNNCYIHYESITKHAKGFECIECHFDRKIN